MIAGHDIAAALVELGVTDVVWLPDSMLGTWEAAFSGHDRLRLLRVCREGEAWVLAAGLYLGGREPVVIMQTTGMFDSGDALRNVYYDMQLPLFAMIGYRSFLLPGSTDSARQYAEPILDAWGLDYLLLGEPADLEQLKRHRQACRAENKPCVVLLPEGRG
ncbi:MAG: hypothetical protein JSS27_04285 [Planctomycetes bacterium]|nr:hypothetical protein [Planctomycetota bacterium]